MPEIKVGHITHYFGRIGVAVLQSTDSGLKAGDTIHIKGHSTDFTQQVESMQVEHETVDELKKGGEVGLKVTEKVHERDEVFKVVD
ncbi:MAG: hypothetical protein JSU73_13850 [candidate division WOR-3 bacterium]|nr:MAG: hypothetical protein JSU73_13850 [candidate division WOR-3 bacterium]